MKLGIKKIVEVDAKYIHIHVKVRDEFFCNIEDDSCDVIGEYEGYVPDFMPSEHYGDYIDLRIDLETGKIVNWCKPTVKQILKLLNKEED